METWLVNILGIVFSIIAALIVITKIFPKVGELASSILGNNQAVASFMSLLVILVYVLLFTGVVSLLKNIDNQFINYVSLLDPAVELILTVLPYIKWAVFALILGAALKQLKK